MASPTLTEQLLALPLDERVVLAEALWRSIGEELFAGEEREAIADATRREAELESHATVGRDHRDVVRAARRSIGCDGSIMPGPG